MLKVCVCSVTFHKIEVINLCLKDTRAISSLRFLVKHFGVCPVGDLG